VTRACVSTLPLATWVLGACGTERAGGGERDGRAADRVAIAASPDDSRPTVSGLAVGERSAMRAVTKLDGDLLSLRLLEVPDAGPWRVRIDWGDGTVDTPAVARPGDQTFLHARRYPRAGRYTIAVTATNAAGHASAPRTVVIAVP